MNFSPLSFLLVTERLRQRASSQGGFSVPAMEERAVPAGAEPILASSMRGAFLQVRRGSDGVARYGFFLCPPAEEGEILIRLFLRVSDLALELNWPNVFSSIPEALAAMRASTVPPKTVVLPTGQELPEGYASVEGVQVVTSPSLPEGSALVAASPPALGVYTRVGDHLGLQFYNVPRTLMVVRPNGSLG